MTIRMRRPFGFAATLFAGAMVLSAASLAAPPSVGPNVNMVQGTQWPVGDPFLTKQNEVSVAVSSRNPRHLLAGANDYRLVPVEIAEALADPEAWLQLFKSMDGGATWTSVPIGGCPVNIPDCNDATGLTAALKALKPNFGADPTVRPGPFGTFFVSFIAGTRNTNANGVIAVQRFVDKNNDTQKYGSAESCTQGSLGCQALYDPPSCTGAGCTLKGYFVVKQAQNSILPDLLNIVDTGTPGQGKDKPWNAADVPRSWNSGTCELLTWTKTASGMKNVAETVPAFNVYVSYANFTGQSATSPNPSINVVVSTDCGKTFGKPTKISTGGTSSQGSSIAIDPQSGAVYVAWRGFTVNSTTPFNAIYLAKSADGGKTWSKPVTVSDSGYYPYDQGSTGVTMRTLGFPTVAVSVKNGQSRVHVAWAQRKAPPATTAPYACQSSTASDCDARIVMATSTDAGGTFSTPVVVDGGYTVTAVQANNSASYVHSRGHQMQPSLTFAAGKLLLTWLDSRLDATEAVLQCQQASCASVDQLVEVRQAMGNLDRTCNRSVLAAPYGPACFNPDAVFSTYLSDGTPGLVRRHTIDVFAAMLDPDATTTANFGTPSSARVSQYAFGSTVAGTIDSNGLLTPVKGTYEIRQKEVHAPNLPLFANGKGAFVGDYMDVAGQPIVATGDAARPYKWNVGGSASDTYTTSGLPPVFYVNWTDNRDVIPPNDGNWVTPTCLSTTLAKDAQGNVIGTTSSGCTNAGFSGNRNQNVYSAVVAENSFAVANATAKLLDPATPRGFVVSVRNLSSTQHTYTIDVATGQTAGVKAAFNRESLPSGTGATTSQQVTVQPRSTAARTVWVTSSVPKAPVIVSVTSPSGDGNLASRLVFNGDQTANLDAVPANGQFVINADGGAVPDTANDSLGNVVLSNAVLTNNVLSNNALTNAVLTNNALTNAALSNVVLSNNVLSNNVLSNNVLSNVVLSNVVLSNNALSNVVLSNVVLSNNALNVALTNLDPTNVALSNAVLSNNALTNVALSNNALSNVMLTNVALTNVVLSNVVLSNNALSNNVLTNNALSNVVLSNAPLVDATGGETPKTANALRTIETGNFEVGGQFTTTDLQNSNFRETSFTVRNRGNTDATLALKLLVRDAVCTETSPGGIADGSGRYTCTTPGYKLQLVLRKVGLTPYAIPPTGPAVDTGRAFQIGLLQRNTEVSNVGTLPIVSPDDPKLGQFLTIDATAATLPLGAGEYAYATIRAVGLPGAGPPPDPEDLLRWGVQAVAGNAGNTGNPFLITTLSFAAPAATATQPASLSVNSTGGTGSVTGTATCTDSQGTAVSITDPPAFVAGPPGYTQQASVACAGAPLTVVAGTAGGTPAKLSFTPKYWGTFYARVSLQDGSSPPQAEQQVLKVVVQPATPAITFTGFPAQITYGQTLDLRTLAGSAITSTSPVPLTFAASYSPTNACQLDADGRTLRVDRSSTVAAGNPSICVVTVSQQGNETYAPKTVSSPAITVTQAQQIISFGALQSPKTYGDAPFAVAATSSSPTAGAASTNPIVFTSSTAAACGTSGPNGTTVGILNAAAVAPGCSINANQAGNANYLSAAQATQSFLINPKPATVTPNAKSKTYGDLDPPLDGSTVGFVDADAVTATYGRVAGEAVGTYTISVASLSAAPGRPLTNYTITSNTNVFTINKRNTSTVVATSLTPAPTGPGVTFTATVSPLGLPGSPAAGTVAPTGSVQFFVDGATSLGTQAVTAVQGSFTATASISIPSTGPNTPLPVGTHTITAVYSSDGNYNASTSPGIQQIIDTPPEVLSDAYGVLKGGTLAVGKPGLLGNDRDVDPGQTIATALPIVTPPQHAAAFAANSDGSFSYTPQAGFTGVDTFTYQATDGQIPGQARTVTISVIDPALATIVAENDAYSVAAAAAVPFAVPAPGVLGNDVTGTGAGVIAVLETGGEPLHAAQANGFTLNGDGSFTYTPAAGFVGRDRFLYRVQAGANGPTSNLAMVTIAVLPGGTTLIAGNDAYTADQDTAFAGSTVIVNDPTATGALPVSGPLYGSLALNGNGSFTYTPNAGFSGMDGFTYVATTGSTATNDLALSNLAMATITVRAKTTTAVTVAGAAYDGTPHGGTAAVTGPPLNGPALNQALSVSYVGRNGTNYSDTVAPTGAGDYTASAGFAATAIYLGSSDSKNFTIAPAATTTTVTALNATYDGSPHGATAVATGAGGLNQPLTPITYTGRNGTSYNDTVAPTGAGDYTASASYAATTNYAASSGSANFTIAPAATTTTVTAANATYDGSPHGATAAATGAGGLNQPLTPITYTGRNGTSYNDTVAPTGAGDYTASASYAGTTNYSASGGSANFTIGKASQAITFGPLANKTTADAPFTVSATSASPTAPPSTIAIVFSSQTAAQCTTGGANGTTVTIVAAGTCTIAANQGGDANYNAAPQVTQSFTINSAAATTTTLATSTPLPPAGPDGLSAFGERVTFTATVTGGASPTGTVRFMNAGLTIVGCAASPLVLNAGQYQATCLINNLPIGAESITATYSGDTNNPPSTSLPLTQNIAGTGLVTPMLTGGRTHTCALDDKGFVWCWGRNDLGELGNQATQLVDQLKVVPAIESQVNPVQVGGIDEASAGAEHTCVLDSSDAVWCWGDNHFGQLGVALATTKSDVRVPISPLPTALAIAAGFQHNCALTTQGAVWCWGDNQYGQLGRGTISVSEYAPAQVTGLAGGVLAIASGQTHSCALMIGGAVKCWGDNTYGQLGNGTNTASSTPVAVAGLSGVSAIAANGAYACALLETGGVKCWGQNGAGQVGDGSFADRSSPVDVAGLGSGVTAITAGGGHACALLATGGLKCWGFNGNGQVGDGTFGNGNDRGAPVGVAGLPSGGVSTVTGGGDHTCASALDGTAYCWGYNNRGQLGNGSTVFPSPVPSAVQMAPPATGNFKLMP